jgi:hypothetical protein
MNWIFVDFGSFRIKCLRASVGAKHLEIQDYLEFESHPEFFDGLDFPTPSAWAAVSVQLHENGWLSDEAGAVISQLPGSYLETRYLQFPFKNEKKIDRVLTMELESQIPFDVEDLIEKHHLLKGPGVVESPKALVHIMTYQRDLIKKYEHELKSFQMSVPAFTADTLSLSALRLALPAHPVTGLLYFGNRKTHWNLFQSSGEILASRLFWWGGDSMAQSLSSSLSVDMGSARERLHSLSEEDLTDAGDMRAIQIRDVVDSQLTLFFNSFRQSLKAHLQAGLELPKPLPIYILGGPSHLPQLAQKFQARFEGEFDLRIEAYPMENLTSVCRNLDQLESPEAAYALIAQGLLQLRSRRGKVYNFSESSFQFQQNLKKIRKQSFKLLQSAALIFLAPLAYLFVSFTLDYLENKRTENSVRQYVAESRLEVNLDQGISSIIDDLRRLNRLRGEMQQALMTDESGPLMLLTLMSQQISSRTKIDIHEFEVTETQVRIVADTNSAESHAEILRSLERLHPELSSSALKACDRFPGCQSFQIQFPREVAL